MVSVHPARWCTSPLGVVPAGLGDGVGHCHDVANLPRVCLFISPVYFFVFLGNKFYFFKSIVMGFSLPLGMLAAKWVPTPCSNDAYSVGTLNGHYGRKAGKSIMTPRFHPYWTFLFGKQKDFYFSGGLYVGCSISGGPGILGLALVIFSGQLSIELINIGGWLTS